MKASVAAVITILLIAVCVIFDLCNKYRVKQQVKKAVADAVERAENAPEKAKVPLVQNVRKVMYPLPYCKFIYYWWLKEKKLEVEEPSLSVGLQENWLVKTTRDVYGRTKLMLYHIN